AGDVARHAATSSDETPGSRIGDVFECGPRRAADRAGIRTRYGPNLEGTANRVISAAAADEVIDVAEPAGGTAIYERGGGKRHINRDRTGVARIAQRAARAASNRARLRARRDVERASARIGQVLKRRIRRPTARAAVGAADGPA